MTAVTTPQPALKIRNNSAPQRLSGVVKTGAVLYLHTLVQQNANGTYAAAVDGTTQRIVGLMVECPDMAAAGTVTGDGTLRAEVVYGVSALIAISGLTAGNNGAAVYATDNFTVSKSTTQGPQAGILEEYVTSTTGWVRIRGGAMAKGAP